LALSGPVYLHGFWLELKAKDTSYVLASKVSHPAFNHQFPFAEIALLLRFCCNQ